VVEVDTDMTVPTATDAVRVRVRNDQGTSLHEVNVDLRQGGPGSRLPGRLSLQPEDPGRLSPIAIEATALRAGQEVLRQDARLSFRSGAVVLLRMSLLAGCACQRCGPGQTCAEGARCGSIARDVNALPLYAPRTTGEERPSPTSCPPAPNPSSPDGSASDSLPDAQPADTAPPLDVGLEAPAAPDAGPDAPGPGSDGGAPPDGSAVPALPLGAACTGGAQCGSRSCVDGVCCSSACASLCMACASTFTGQPDGQCAPVRAGTDPRADCAADAPTSCRYDGTCDGAGACRLHVAGTLCGPPMCANGTYTPPARCTGTGVCNLEVPKDCLLFACTLDRGCLTRCTTDAECVQNSYCAAGDCLARKRKGLPCMENRECLTDACVDGKCADHR
jgi:hypothetical protein